MAKTFETNSELISSDPEPKGRRVIIYGLSC